MLIGYARVSTDEQHTENQVEQLVKAGCETGRIYKDTASGGCWDRPQLHKALEQLRPGDTLVFWKIDRLSRSLSDLLRILEKVDKAGASFRSLTEPLDTSTAMGKMHMQIIGVFSEFERAMIKERTNLGLKRARANGRIGGARFKLSQTRRAEAIKMVRSGEKSQSEVAELFDVDKGTISRMMKEIREKELLTLNNR
jgi:DNA invertase Pin-like site-specific DNA recombinase